MKKAIIISLLLVMSMALSAQAYTYQVLYIQVYDHSTEILGGKEHSGSTLTVKIESSEIYSITVSGEGMERSNQNMSKLQFIQTTKKGETLYYVYINPDKGERFMTIATTRKLDDIAIYGEKSLILVTYGGQSASFVLTVL